MKSDIDWPHAPLHRLDSGGIFIVTAATYQKQHLFHGSQRLELLQGNLFSLAKRYDCRLEAWAVFPNHYHFVARNTAGENTLRKLLSHLHGETAREINRLDETTGRRVWFNFWETRLTFEKSYLARLNYVHQNAVKHGVVRTANQYPWCSAAWFERIASPAIVNTIYGFKTDRITIADAY